MLEEDIKNLKKLRIVLESKIRLEVIDEWFLRPKGKNEEIVRREIFYYSKDKEYVGYIKVLLKEGNIQFSLPKLFHLRMKHNSKREITNKEKENMKNKLSQIVKEMQTIEIDLNEDEILIDNQEKLDVLEDVKEDLEISPYDIFNKFNEY